MTFAACIPIILMSEGGYVNNPRDPGGPTNLGITQQTLSGWLGHAASVADVQALTQAQVEPIYQADYYNAAHCQQLAAGIDLMIFDEAVNQGVGRAIRTLQQAAGVTADEFSDRRPWRRLRPWFRRRRSRASMAFAPPSTGDWVISMSSAWAGWPA